MHYFFQLMRKDLNEHNTAYNNRHTELLLHKYLATNSELIETKEELKDTKQEIIETKQELGQAKETIRKLEEIVDDLKESTANSTQKCFQVIEKSTNLIAENIINGRNTRTDPLLIPKTFEDLLPLLNEDDFKNFVDIHRVEEIEKIETIEYNAQKYEFKKLNKLVKIPLMKTTMSYDCLLYTSPSPRDS